VASLFRNFLLAQRIFHSLNCGVISCPTLPPTHLHPLWQSWDLAADQCLAQLSRYERHATPFTPSTFFEEQLTSFEVWLEFGVESKPAPMQLPVVLQVLLSTDHRLRALQLLARFLDKGSWAVKLALSVGIFPYVLKLLQSPARELREVLVFIWAKVLSLDQTCQQDLAKTEYAQYFIHHLIKYHNHHLHTIHTHSPTNAQTHSPIHVHTNNMNMNMTMQHYQQLARLVDGHRAI